MKERKIVFQLLKSSLFFCSLSLDVSTEDRSLAAILIFCRLRPIKRKQGPGFFARYAACPIFCHNFKNSNSVISGSTRFDKSRWGLIAKKLCYSNKLLLMVINSRYKRLDSEFLKRTQQTWTFLKKKISHKDSTIDAQMNLSHSWRPQKEALPLDSQLVSEKSQFL